MITSIILEPGQKFKAPDCSKCGSWNTYTQGTRQTPPWTIHKCKCKNCGNNYTVFSQRKKSTPVDDCN